MDEKILIITGPTAIGKTAVAEEIAKKIGAEIISADSGQVYRYLTIGTAKPVGSWKKFSSGEKFYVVDDIFYHLVDFLEPTVRFSAGEFVTSTLKLIPKIRQRNRQVIIVGGSGLYIQALIKGLAPLPRANPDIRMKYQEMLKKFGLSYLQEKLQKKDPLLAGRIGPNPHRLIRALEILEITGKSPGEFYPETKPFLTNYCLINLDVERQVLTTRIKMRINSMLQNGLLDETAEVLKKYPADCPGLQCIGYPEAISYLRKKISKQELVEQIFLSTKKYAKRQRTWARGHNYPTLDITKMTIDEVVNYLLNIV